MVVWPSNFRGKNFSSSVMSTLWKVKRKKRKRRRKKEIVSSFAINYVMICVDWRKSWTLKKKIYSHSFKLTSIFHDQNQKVIITTQLWVMDRPITFYHLSSGPFGKLLSLCDIRDIDTQFYKNWAAKRLPIYSDMAQ